MLALYLATELRSREMCLALATAADALEGAVMMQMSDLQKINIGPVFLIVRCALIENQLIEICYQTVCIEGVRSSPFADTW